MEDDRSDNADDDISEYLNSDAFDVDADVDADLIDEDDTHGHHNMLSAFNNGANASAPADDTDIVRRMSGMQLGDQY
jgi:hypothetical protein